MNKNIDYRFYEFRSENLRNQFQFDKAAVVHKRLLTRNPKSYEDHRLWAHIRLDQEEYRLAELKLREVVIINPEDYKALNSLGIVLSKQGKHDEAISSYQKASKLKDNELNITYNIAIEYTLKGDYEEAIEWYEKALILSPSDASTHNCMGYLYLLQGKYTEAITKFDDAIQNDSNFELPFFNKAIIFFCQAGAEGISQDAFEFGIKALAQVGFMQKLRRLKTVLSTYSDELNRIRKELDYCELESERRVNLEKIKKGLEYIVDLLKNEMKT